MDVFGLLEVSFMLLDWVIDWIWVLCGMIFALIMVKTLIDVIQQAVDQSAPGINRFTTWKR